MSKRGTDWAHQAVHTDDFKVKLMACVMGYASNGEGYLFPRQQYLAEQSGLSLASVKRTLKKMQDHGLLTIHANQVGKHKTFNAYTLRLDQQFFVFDKPVEGITQTRSTVELEAAGAVDKSVLKGSHRHLQAVGRDQPDTFKGLGRDQPDTFEGVSVSPLIQKHNVNINTQFKYVMYANWVPDKATVSALSNGTEADMPVQFVKEQVPVFVMYWIEQGNQHKNEVWQSKFKAHAIKRWGWNIKQGKG